MHQWQHSVAQILTVNSMVMCILPHLEHSFMVVCHTPCTCHLHTFIHDRQGMSCIPLDMDLLMIQDHLCHVSIILLVYHHIPPPDAGPYHVLHIFLYNQVHVLHVLGQYTITYHPLMLVHIMRVPWQGSCK